MNLSIEFKKNVANLYLENRNELDELNPKSLEIFTLKLLNLIGNEKEKIGSIHDLEVLEENMNHLRRDTKHLTSSKHGTDDYDFARNDCMNILNSMNDWLMKEKLI